MRGWIGVLLIGLLLAVTAPATAAMRTALAQLPPVPTPAPLPSLPVPLPVPVPVPTIQALPLPVPTVQAPSLPVPAPQLPQLTPVPSSPAPTSSSSAPAPVASTRAQARGDATQAAGSGPASTPASRSSQPSGVSSSQASPSRSSSARSSGASGGRTMGAQRFRQTVRRLRGCLAELPKRQARVLALRAGVGQRKPLTVAETASRIGLRDRQVRRIQRRALRTLRRAARDGCSAAPAPDGSGPETTVAPTGTAIALADAGTGAVAPDPSGTDSKGGGTGSSGGTSSSHGAVKDEQREHHASRQFPGAFLAPSEPFPPILLAIPAVAGAIWFAVSRIRRRRRIQNMRYY